ncbi:pentatricopeptide repeat-containing protein At1g08070, chloroplastic-like [Corylus avellana]|uniref:pentatricopeptide repeat-containing protein At1g08070, chloroplastic-like n=1 Tax=Corylus avellana TaxID=13451 RepID=UPI00286B6795|nr:pentatricopeptide repeat-containing protein At1g08070, chloroplastic-like [Corylus avellana]
MRRPVATHSPRRKKRDKGKCPTDEPLKIPSLRLTDEPVKPEQPPLKRTKVAKPTGSQDPVEAGKLKLAQLLTTQRNGNPMIMLKGAIPHLATSSVVWNTIIRGHSLRNNPILAVEFYVRMILCGAEPNSYTFPFVLKSCAKVGATHEGKQVHAQLLKLGLECDAFVHTSLVNMYTQNGELENARLVFDKSTLRDAVSFTTLITGYAARGLMGDARGLFDEIPMRDVVSWTAMIAGYAQCGWFEEALAFFEEMQKMNIQPHPQF